MGQGLRGLERKTVSNDGKAVTIWTVVGALMAVGAVVGFLTTLWGDVGDIRVFKATNHVRNGIGFAYVG